MCIKNIFLYLYHIIYDIALDCWKTFQCRQWSLHSPSGPGTCNSALKFDKYGDEVGLTAESLGILLRLYHDVLYTGELLASCSKIVFTIMLRKDCE